MKIDIEKLRKDIINYYESAYFIGGYGAASLKTEEIKEMSDEDLIEEARKLKII